MELLIRSSVKSKWLKPENLHLYQKKRRANSNEVQFHEGAAAISFHSDTPVKEATSAIVRTLGISGVNRVDASFPSPSSPVPNK